MLQLVEAHKQLDDPMETAIWIRQNDRDRAWLVEVIPAMANDQYPERPVVFTAGGGFRYPLHLIGVNLSDIENALKRDTQLASWVADGEVLHGRDVGDSLITMARNFTTDGNA